MKTPHFLNVDLEIESKSSLRPLAREFGDQAVIMFSGKIKGRHWLYIETAVYRKQPDATIQALCALIEKLSSTGRRLWDTAQRKTFDIGYETRLSSELANQFQLRPTTLRRLAALGATLAITIYREEDPLMLLKPVKSGADRRG